MNLTVVTPPPFEPVSMEMVYTHLRLDPDGSPLTHPDDDLLREHITTAREFVETGTRRALVQQTLRLSTHAFPIYAGGCWLSGWRSSPERIKLIRPPLIRVERVSYYDGENALVDLDPADYFVTDDLVPELRFAAGFAAPAVYNRPDALRIEYVAGYQPFGSPPDETQAAYAHNVPSALKNAVLIGVQLLYDNLPQNERDALELMRGSLIRTKQIPLTP
jgi:uncharacterized phiE125 gp8 family phage protein